MFGKLLKCIRSWRGRTRACVGYLVLQFGMKLTCSVGLIKSLAPIHQITRDFPLLSSNDKVIIDRQTDRYGCVLTWLGATLKDRPRNTSLFLSLRTPARKTYVENICRKTYFQTYSRLYKPGNKNRKDIL